VARRLCRSPLSFADHSPPTTPVHLWAGAFGLRALRSCPEGPTQEATRQELSMVSPELLAGQVQWLLTELKRERRIHVVGRTKGARWYPETPDN